MVFFVDFFFLFLHISIHSYQLSQSMQSQARHFSAIPNFLAVSLISGLHLLCKASYRARGHLHELIDTTADLGRAASLILAEGL